MIKDFPIERYKFHIDPGAGVVVALSTFAGKQYRGVARCSKDDHFDEEYGKRLAAARCGLRIARARTEAATGNYYLSQLWAEQANEICQNDWVYLREAEAVEAKAFKALAELIG